jgi:RNA polymerase-binding protein DksA
VAVAKKKSSKKTAKKTRKSAKKSAKKAAKKTTRKSAAKKSSKKTASKSRKKASSGKATSTGGSRKTRQRRAASKDYLSKKELADFRQMLVEKRKSLVGDMANMSSGSYGRSLQDSSGDLSNMPTHPADIGSDNFEHEFTLGLLESERALLCEINEALERIDNGTYGICLGTGEPIGKPRLKARPWCKFSIEYQRMIEQGLVRPRDHEEEDEDEEDDDDLLDEDERDEDDEDEGDRDDGERDYDDED